MIYTNVEYQIRCFCCNLVLSYADNRHTNQTLKMWFSDLEDLILCKFINISISKIWSKYNTFSIITWVRESEKYWTFSESLTTFSLFNKLDVYTCILLHNRAVVQIGRETGCFLSEMFPKCSISKYSKFHIIWSFDLSACGTFLRYKLLKELCFIYTYGQVTSCFDGS